VISETIQHKVVGWLSVTNWKECGRKWSWPNMRYYPGFCLDGPRKILKTLSQDSGCPAEIQTDYLTDTSQVLPLWTNCLLGNYTIVYFSHYIVKQQMGKETILNKMVTTIPHIYSALFLCECEHRSEICHFFKLLYL
jgi:hypothetical protein